MSEGIFVIPLQTLPEGNEHPYTSRLPQET